MMRALAATALAAIVALGGAPAAHAAPGGGVLVSSDGVTFTSTLPAGVFGSAVLVPGATRTATLYVKNDSGVASELFLTVANAGASSPDLAGALTLSAASGARPPGPAVALDAAAPCATLLVQGLAPGAVARLTLTLAMRDVDHQVAQGDTVAATVGVALQQSDTPIAPVSRCDLDGIQLPVLGLHGDDDDGDGGAVLAADGILYPALMTAGLLGGGVLLVAARRRRRRDR